MHARDSKLSHGVKIISLGQTHDAWHCGHFRCFNRVKTSLFCTFLVLKYVLANDGRQAKLLTLKISGSLHLVEEVLSFLLVVESFLWDEHSPRGSLLKKGFSEAET